MTSLERRIEDVIGQRTGSDWDDLIRLFEADAEAFYLLACDGAGESVKDLAKLASDIRSAIRATYDIVPAESGANVVTASGETTFIPHMLISRVTEFLRAVDGKVTSIVPGKDYVGAPTSEAEMRFKLGEASTWESDRAVLRSRAETPPLVLRVHQEDIEHLAAQPAYVTYGLLNCARKTILAPTAVFKGLNRGDDCPPELKDGSAFCGKPRQAFDNEGHAIPAPEGMVYMVYADEEGFVFDWDWVQESVEEPGFPIDSSLRFGNPCELNSDAVLELPEGVKPGTFDAKQATYSSKGDCIFCYMTDEPAMAARINSDLTVFKSLDGDNYTGFKIKNVRRILQVDQTIEMTDAPGLAISVDAFLLATLKRHPEGNVQVYRVLIHALYSSSSEPPTVTVPKAAPDLVIT